MFFLLPLAALVAGSVPSTSVLDVYREACFDGQLQLTPERGEVTDTLGMPSILFNQADSAKPRQVTYVRMKQPAHTFVMIEQYDSPRAKFETICKVASTQWVEEDAQRAFIAGTTKPKILDTRDSGHPFEPYVIDQPANGLRKRLFVRNDWVMIETAVYRQTK